jgi:predicted lipoprotein with Yx(FWY)xxD motif
MKRLLLAGAAVAAALTLAACGGGNESSPADTAAPGGAAATVSAVDIGGAGLVLVDSTGKALYASDEETAGDVLCTEACTAFWTPLTIGAEQPTASSLPGALGVFERPDGARQVTYDGKLLYSFTEDEPGEVTGDGFADAFDGQQFTWHVVHADGSEDSSGAGSGTSPYRA